MKKVKHPLRTVLLTTLLASASFFGGCLGCKTFKKTPTPEELWERSKEIENEMQRKVMFEKKTPQKRIERD